MLDPTGHRLGASYLNTYFRSSGEGSKRRVVGDSAMRRGGAFGDEAGPRQYLLEQHEDRVPQKFTPDPHVGKLFVPISVGVVIM